MLFLHFSMEKKSFWGGEGGRGGGVFVRHLFLLPEVKLGTLVKEIKSYCNCLDEFYQINES